MLSIVLIGSTTKQVRRFKSLRRYSLASLSVIVITLNEAHNIESCLRSVAFADQVVVLDSGSTDDTLRIASAMGAEVSSSHEWRGFGVQKNLALAQARCEWVLSLDADEQLSPALQAEIQATLAAPVCDVYSFARLSSYCGQNMYYSGWYPDRVVRLFRRNFAHFSNDLVHERVVTDCTVGKLRGYLLHESYRNFEEVLDKGNRYSSAGALGMLKQGKTSSVGKAFGRGLWAFVRTYFLRLGFLDGTLGLLLAISTAESTYYRYLKLWYLQLNPDQSPPRRE